MMVVRGIPRPLSCPTYLDRIHEDLLNGSDFVRKCEAIGQARGINGLEVVGDIALLVGIRVDISRRRRLSAVEAWWEGNTANLQDLNSVLLSFGRTYRMRYDELQRATDYLHNHYDGMLQTPFEALSSHPYVQGFANLVPEILFGQSYTPQNDSSSQRRPALPASLTGNDLDFSATPSPRYPVLPAPEPNVEDDVSSTDDKGIDINSPRKNCCCTIM